MDAQPDRHGRGHRVTRGGVWGWWEWEGGVGSGGSREGCAERMLTCALALSVLYSLTRLLCSCVSGRKWRARVRAPCASATRTPTITRTSTGPC